MLLAIGKISYMPGGMAAISGSRLGLLLLPSFEVNIYVHMYMYIYIYVRLFTIL